MSASEKQKHDRRPVMQSKHLGQNMTKAGNISLKVNSSDSDHPYQQQTDPKLQQAEAVSY